MSETLLLTLSGLAIVLFVPIALCVFSIRYEPIWVAESPLDTNWKKLNLLGLSLSIALTLATWFLYADFHGAYKLLASLSTGIMSFVAVQTFSTDFTLRLADRRLLRIANIVSLAAGLWFLINFTNQTIVLLYAIFIIFASILLFFPKLGASDARAVQLVVLSAFPVLGTQNFQLGFIVVAIFVIGYGVVRAIQSGDFKKYFSKISIPLVPLIITPFIVLILLNSFMVAA